MFNNASDRLNSGIFKLPGTGMLNVYKGHEFQDSVIDFLISILGGEGETSDSKIWFYNMSDEFMTAAFS